MNKLGTLLILVTSMAIGCSDKKAAPSTEPASAPKPADPPKAEPPPSMPEQPGSAAADPAAAGSGAAAAGAMSASGNKPTCDQKIAITCEKGFVDGCDDKRTKVHICIAADAKGTHTCDQEIAKVCPEGQVDSCIANRAFADTHICVVK